MIIGSKSNDVTQDQNPMIKYGHDVEIKNNIFKNKLIF